ncbi:hypothetical protein LUZ60_015900 [Juncus effusus]|nr:hypothetical protein LUZ60_015900 [Juncus effusus]
MAPKKEKPKPSPASAAAQPPPPLEDLFSTLNRHVQNYEFAQAVKLADQVLAIAPGDEDAVRCKIVALIKSDAIDKALDAINAASKLPFDLSFYKAYCLYRQNKLQEALECIQSQEKTATILQLESQIYYRLGKMDSCIESYENLKKFKIDSLDLKTNIIAAYIAAGKSNEVESIMSQLKVKPSNSFEIAYNTACSLVEKNKYVEAEQMLLSARRIGQEMLMEEDYGDEEIESELAPISVQLAYVRQLMGHDQESMEEYSSIISKNLADPSSLAIATNNLIALKEGKEISDGLKKLDKIIIKGNGDKPFEFVNGLEYRLNPRQKEAIFSNRVLLLLQANKIDQAQEIVSMLQKSYPQSITPTVLQAAVFVREKKIPKAEEILSQYASKSPQNSQNALLTLAQIASSAGHYLIASESLSKIPEIQHAPAVVATSVSLLTRLGQLSSASSVLDNSIQWWENSMEENREMKLGILIPESANFKLKTGKEDQAAGLYEELVKRNGKSVEALVGLVKTAAKFDLEKAERYEKQLKPLTGLKRVDVESLEKTAGAKQLDGGSSMTKMEISDEVKKAKAKKRKRKPKYPKGYDPANPGPPPDPERWLPKRERSTYRPKRKDKRAQIRGAQGSVSRDKHDSTTNTGTGTSTSASVGTSGVGSSKASEQNRGKSRKKKSRN